MSEEIAKTRQDIITKVKEVDTVAKKLRLVALNHHLEAKKTIDEQLEKEMKELTLKYEKLSEPIYSQYTELINGTRVVTEEEISLAKEFLTEEEQGKVEENKGNQDKLDRYWLTCFKNCEMIAHDVHEHDEPILAHLINAQYVPNQENTLKFKFIFTFSENEFFENTELTKEFELIDDEEPKSAIGTKINWKEGKDITVKTVKKTQKNKKSGAKRVISKEVEAESFFNFFKDHLNLEQEGNEDDEDLEDEDLEKIHIDYEIARGLIDEVIPYNIEYFLGVKESEGGLDMGDEEGSDDEDDEAPKPKKKTHKKSGDSTKSGDGKEKPECKNQ